MLLLFPLGSLAAGQTTSTAEDLILKTLEAAGGQNAVSAVRTVSFKIGPQTYIAAADGRLKVKAAIEAAVVYEAILVAGGTVRRNTLNRTSVVAGAKAVRGFSTHQPAKTLPEAIASGRFDVVLMTYNHMESSAAEPLIAQARAKGIGTIAMKVFAGGKQGSLKSLVNERLKYSQAALRWVLGNPAIDGLIITMSTFAHVEEYLAASGQFLRRKDLRLIARYRDEASPIYCRVSCDACRTACPYGVAVNEVLRCAMYYEDYRMEGHALRIYAGREEGRKPIPCDACDGPCETACPHGIEVRARLLRSHALLGPDLALPGSRRVDMDIIIM